MEECTWKGASGTPYTFEIDIEENIFAPLSCVYVYVNRIDDFNFFGLYVGIADDIQDRFNYHGTDPRDAWFRAKLKEHKWNQLIGVIIVDDEDKRVAIEKDLLANTGLPWPLNRQRPKAG